jgi:hypothetical protein
MHNKSIYSKNWKIPAARQKFSVRGSISVTARPRTRAAYREHKYELSLTSLQADKISLYWNTDTTEVATSRTWR